MLGVVPGDRREDLCEIWGEELLSLETENTREAKRDRAGDKQHKSLDKNDVTTAKMKEFEHLLEASGFGRT